MSKIKLSLLACVFVFLGKNILAQETIKVMQYNLMYYGKNVYECTSTTNYIEDKNKNLKTIIQYVKPDIFGVNELDGNKSYPISDDASYLLDNALNVDGVDYYRKTDFPNIYLANTVFYNSNKLILKSHYPISFFYGGLEKVFNVYKFYFNSDDLETTKDTAFVSFLVAHLKAGSYSEGITQRAYESTVIMNYYESLGEKGNYILMGDFNLYSPTETAFQSFINPDNSLYTFNDPANQIGEWSSNYNYRNYHTQSTHTSGECFSLGGMDDRFDFILASDNIINGTDHYKYIDDSYKVIGQDGSNYNSSLNISSNSVVPSDVANALYNMSDHLPVYLELQVNQNLGEPLDIKNPEKNGISVLFENPVSEKLSINIKNIENTQVFIELYSLKGELKFKNTYSIINKNLRTTIPVTGISSGIYILNIKSSDNIVFSDKVIVKK